MPAFSTTWTGAAGNGLWSDPGNWSNGVPLSGVPVASGADDVATIDNSVETTPFTLTIDGVEAGDTVNVNLTDPAAAPSVILTGSLDLTNNVQPGGGGGLGTLNLNKGTFQLAGGTLRALVFEQGGDFNNNGALTFADQNTVASGISGILDAVGIQDDFTIGNNANVQIKNGSFAIFEAAHGGAPDLVTVDGGAIFDVQGSLSMHGELDVVSGSLQLQDGTINGDSFGANIVEESGQQLLVVGTSGGTLINTTVTGDIAFSNVQSSGQPLFLTLDSDDTLQAAPGASAPATLNLAVDSGGAAYNVVEIAGSVTLDDELVENGLVQLDQGGVLKFGATNSIGGFADLTINAFDTSSASAPTVIDLNGGTYTVSGTLSLNNVLFSNGTINLSSGASIIVNDHIDNSIGDFTNVTVAQVIDVPTTTTLTGNPDVHIVGGDDYALQSTDLDVMTGVSGGPGKLYLDGSSSFDGPVGEISGAGVIRVQDNSGGPSAAIVLGLIEADQAGQTLQLSAANWTLYDPTQGLQGEAKSVNGSKVELGDGVSTSGVTDLNGGVLSNGTYDAVNGGAIQIDGDAPITTLARADVILDGAASRFFVASPGGVEITDLQNSLTSIGQAQVGFAATLGGLQLLNGADFNDSSHALDLYGSIVLQGGSVEANGIRSHLSVISQQAFFGAIQGYGTVNSSDSGAGSILAKGGLLTVNGNLTSIAVRTVEGTGGATNGSIFVAGDDQSGALNLDAGTTATVTGDVIGGTLTLGVGATARIEGAFTNGFGTIGAAATLTLDSSLASSGDQFFFANDGMSGGTLDLLTPSGATAQIGPMGNTTLEGNRIHLQGALLNETSGPGSGLELAAAGGGKVQLTVHLKDDAGTALSDETFLFNGADLQNIGVTTSLDGMGGTYLVFGDDSANAKYEPFLSVPVLPNVHVKAGGDDSVETVVTNPDAPNTYTVDGQFSASSETGQIVASGGFTDLQPGHSTDEIATALQPPAEGAPIKVGVKTDTAGAISGSLDIKLNSNIDPMTAAGLPGDPTTASTKVETVKVAANVYDFAKAVFPTTTFYLHEGEDPQLDLPVINQVITNAGYQEGLLAAFDGPTIQGSLTSIAGATSLLAAGATNATSLRFQANTGDDAPDVQSADLSVKLTSDGTGASGLGQTDQGDRLVPVTVKINQYADIEVGSDDGSVSLTATSTTPDPNQSLPVIVKTGNLGTFYVGQNVDEIILGVVNERKGMLQDTAKASPEVDPSLQDAAFSNNFSPNQAAPGDDAELGSFRISTSAGAIGTHTEGILFNPESVNPTSSTLMQQAEVEYTYTLVANPNPTARGVGDPHLTTFDGLHYDFMGAGDFILAQTTGAALVAGDNFAVQARTVGTGSVSYFHEIAVETGSHRVSINSDRGLAGTGVLWIDGAAVDIGVDGTKTLSDGATVHRVSSGEEYIVTTAHDETVDAADYGSYVQVVTQLGVNGPKGQVQGLLGDGDGNYQNDLQLSDGHGGYTSPGITLTAAQLYSDPNSLANTWRITDQSKSLLDYAVGQSTATDNVLDFPASPLTFADLPSSLKQAAQNAVAGAGVTDGTLAADAAYDYALTGNANFINAAVAAQQQTQPTGTTATVTVTPPSGGASAALGIGSTAASFADNSSAVGQVYLTGALTTSLTVDYSVVDTGLSGYLTTAQFGATPTTGSVTLTAGQTSANFSLTLPGIGADVSDELRIAITGATTADSSAPPAEIASTADFRVVNHTPTEGVDAAPAFVEISGGGAFVQTDATHWSLNLGSIVSGGNAPSVLLGVANSGPQGADLLSGAYGFSGVGSSDGSFTTQNQIAPTNLASGATSAGLQILANNGTLGAHSETITLTPTQSNASGFFGSLTPIVLTIDDNIVAAPPAAPTVTITSPSDTSTASYLITGTAEAGTVVTLTDNGTPIGLNAPVDNSGAWSETLTLALGANSIAANDKDAYGQTGGATQVVTFAAACYVKGTRILTDRGEVAIEFLRVGDLAVTASGALRPDHVDRPSRARHPPACRSGGRATGARFRGRFRPRSATARSLALAWP